MTIDTMIVLLGLTEDGYIYHWLDTLLEAENQTANQHDSNIHKVMVDGPWFPIY